MRVVNLVQRILWAEIILKTGAGLALLIAPLTFIAITGLAKPESGFWPRLLGGATVGIAAGIWVGFAFPEARGAIGPAGLIPINLLAAAMLIAPLILGAAAPTGRGKLLLSTCVVLLLGLAFLEIAHA